MGDGSAVPRLSPTPDRLWHDHADKLRRLADESLGGDADAVKLACYRTLLRAAREISDWTAPTPPDGSWTWLSLIAEGVCDEIRSDGFAPSDVPDGSVLDALPAGLRVSLFLRAARERSIHELEMHGADDPVGEAILGRRRAWRAEWERRRFRGLPIAILLPRGWSEAIERRARVARDWCRRVEAHLTPTATGTPRLANFLAGSPALSDAAVAVTAALALGVGGVPARPATIDTEVAASQEIAAPAPQVASPATPPPADTLLPPFPPPAPREASSPSQPASPAPDPAPLPEPVEPPGASGPKVSPTTETEPVAQRPFEEGYHSGAPGTSYETPSVRATVDADGDGREEADVGAPRVFVDCPPPEQRKPVMQTLCGAMELSGVGE